MRIGPHDTRERVLVMAELGNNHEGDVGVARELVEAAAAAGAGAVKVQVFDPQFYVGPGDPARLAQLERFRLSIDDFAGLAELAHARGLAFVATFFDLGSADAVEPFADAFKVASGDNDNPAFLRRAARGGLPVIVSLGLTGVDGARRVADTIGADERLALLHCVSVYPVPPEAARMRTIPALAEALPRVTVGYSDHTLGLDAAVTAVALGARVVEKHVTLRRDFSDFRDHQLSAEPHELADLVTRIGATEALLGSAKGGMLEVEEPVAAAARRSLAAARDLEAGHVVASEDITWLRPAGGLRPGDEEQVIGRRLRRALARGERFAQSELEA